MDIWIWYCLLGCVVGVLGGLLGIGGGVIIVPALGILFAKQQILPEQIQHLAVGTSLATILFTSFSSMMAHHQRESVAWPIVRRMAPAIVIGTLSGSWLATLMSTRILQWVFVVFLYCVAAQLLAKEVVRPSRVSSKHTLAMTLVGGAIGALASMVGIGGGSMIVPFLTWCNIATRIAIGTSSAIGLFIALTGTIGSAAFGHQSAALPPYSLGFVYLPAVAGMAIFSVATAPLGAKLAHRLPVSTLRKGFAMLLVVLGTKLLFSLLGG